MRTDPEARFRELDGTLAFVDLSGFTAMSERLSRLGKAGAEEVADVISRTFSRLLDVAYASGGGLVKFGGDALLLFFDGDGHALRAARATYGMRRTLREIGRPQTSAGTVSLRMHVGVHSDTFQFFLVGRSHRELLLTGPAVTETVKMEGAAQAGEILLSAAAAAQLPSDALGAARDGGRLLKGEVSAPEVRIEVGDARGLIDDCVPRALRAELASGTPEPEHRRATVAFLRFSGTDALLAEASPAENAARLEQFVQVVQDAADEHAITFLESDVDRDGGRLLLVAGAPQTTANDEERMLRTLRLIADAETGLQLRAGVHRGRIFAGEVGAPFRRTYTILGETAAVAARLMAHAEPGQIIATPGVVERSRTRFETAELPPFRVKGKTELMAALDVRGITGVRSAPGERRLPFVGRERELVVVGGALAPVRMGFGSLVEVTAEAGMGKSRLVEELRAQCGDMKAVSAACEQYEQSTAYFPFRGLLRSLLELPANDDGADAEALRTRVEQLDMNLVPWIPLLAIPLDVTVPSTREVDELQPAFRRARLHGAVEEVFGTLLPTPTFIAFEDVHWMDEASCDLLRHLGGQVSRRPWLICATRRPTSTGFVAAGGVPAVPAMTITLEPLTDDAALALVGAAAADDLAPEELAAITDRAGGNPLFLQELVTAPGREEAEAELPETVESVVAARIDMLDPGDRALLRYAAVMGATFSGTLIGDVLAGDASASADSEAWDRLVEFVERDPYTPGAFRFRHALFRDAAYEGLSFKRRRELHARVGEAYEQRYPDQQADYAQLLSLHFFQARVWEKAYRYSLLAGRSARAKFANIESATLYRRALEVARHLSELDRGEVAEVWEALGDVLELAGQYGEAADAYSGARKLVAKDAPDQPRLLLKEGVIRERSARYPEAVRWYNRALDAAGAIEDEQARRRITLELELAYAGVRLRQGSFAKCIEWCRKALERADAGEDQGAMAHAYYLMHLAHTSTGNADKQAFRGLALPIYEELGDLLGQANVLNNLGIDAYYDGRWDEALPLYERSKDLRDRIGDVVGVATITNNVAEIRADQGYLDEARDLFEEALQVFKRAGYRYMANLATSNLGRVAVREHRCGDARPLLTEALAGFEEIRAASFVLETRARIAECAMFSGQPEEAIELVDGTLRAAGSTGTTAVLGAMLYRIRACALALRDELDAATSAVEKSILFAREGGAAYELALSLEASARLAALRGEDAAQLESEGAEIFERLGVVSRPMLPV